MNVRVRAPGSTTVRVTVSKTPASPTTTLSPTRKPSGSATVMTVAGGALATGSARDVPNTLAVTLTLLPTRPGARATAVRAGFPRPLIIVAIA